MPCDPKSQFSENDIPDLTGYVIIVTGGNSGIGYETAFHLAAHNARVYISSRSEGRVNEAIASMEQRARRPLDLRFLKLDLQDLRSVKQTAQDFASKEQRLDVLINNAGIMGVPYAMTKDGYESQWQVNYLAPFVLTTSLLPLLLQTAASCGRKDRVRVVNLASDLTSMVGPKTIQLDDVNLSTAKGMTVLLQRYAHSKQGSIRHAKELNDRFHSQGLTAYSLHPGVTPSNLQGHDPSLFGKAMNLTMKVTPTDTPLKCSLTALYCATMSEAFETGAGHYHVPVAKLSTGTRQRTWVEDKRGNEELYAWSEAVLKSL